MSACCVDLSPSVIVRLQQVKLQKKYQTRFLQKHGFEDAISIKPVVNKEAMREWSDERLGLVDATRVVEDKFWIETKENDLEGSAA